MRTIAHMDFEGYVVQSLYEGAYNVHDEDDGERVAYVSLFMPGPMVSVTGPRITSPALARAIAWCMVEL
jgi:hypothetical protein